MRKLLVISGLSAVLVLASPLAARAATTAAQLVALSRAGLSDDILIALIETDGSIFELTADDIMGLHNAGLSDAVIRAMQATQSTARRTMPGPPAPAEAPAPPVVYVTQTVTQHFDAPTSPSPAIYTESPVYIPVAVPAYATVPRAVSHPAPVYWGWGGQRRPDTWQEDPRATSREPESPRANTKPDASHSQKPESRTQK
jgi:hypothetical protein